MKRVISLNQNRADVFNEERKLQIPYYNMYGKDYCATSVAYYTPEEMNKLKYLSEKVDHIYQKALSFAQNNMPGIFFTNQLGIDRKYVASIREEIPFHGVSRQDWIVYQDKFYFIENNTDTPTGIPEVGYLAGSLITEYTSFSNPSESMDSSIQQSFTRLIEYYRSKGLSGKIVFSSFDWHEEDKKNTLYLMNQVQELGYQAEYVSLEDLEVIPSQGLYAHGEKVDIWYRLYPLEYLVDDQDEAANPVGHYIIDLIHKGKLGLINPIQSVITQSKGFYAFIWRLFEENENLQVFTEEECSVIQQHFLPTYFKNHVFLQQEVPYVAKAIYGREGKGTILYDQAGTKEYEVDKMEYYDSQLKIYQQRVPMEKVDLETEAGAFSGYLLTGVFVIGGRFSGVLPRVGEIITGDLAYFCPAVTK